jgi:hypothetical protein
MLIKDITQIKDIEPSIIINNGSIPSGVIIHNNCCLTYKEIVRVMREYKKMLRCDSSINNLLGLYFFQEGKVYIDKSVLKVSKYTIIIYDKKTININENGLFSIKF